MLPKYKKTPPKLVAMEIHWSEILVWRYFFKKGWQGELARMTSRPSLACRSPQSRPTPHWLLLTHRPTTYSPSFFCIYSSLSSTRPKNLLLNRIIQGVPKKVTFKMRFVKVSVTRQAEVWPRFLHLFAIWGVFCDVKEVTWREVAWFRHVDP